MDPLRPLLRPPPLRRPRPAHWAAADAALTVVIALAYTVPFRQLADLRAVPDWAAAVILAVAVLPAAFRRRWPRAVLALAVAGGAAATALSSSPAPVLAVAFVMYLVPLRLPPRESLGLLAGVLVVLGAAVTVFAVVPHGAVGRGGSGPAASLFAEDGLLVVAAWAVGYSVHQQRLYAASRQEETDRRAREQLAEARRARSEERLQIARELHDVVAHTMSLIAVQAGVANYVAGTQPEEAARALSSIEQTSRGALREMRALLGVLRAEDGPGPDPRLGPAPGLADLHILAERAVRAGVHVDLEMDDDRPALSPGLDLAAYRVVQEAITNVIKHAATGRCRVRVTGQDVLTLEISDGGAADGGAADGGGGLTEPGAAGVVPGHGLAGMRERVAMYGGEFEAGPVPGGGFRVTARFPLGQVGPVGPGPVGDAVREAEREETGA